METSTAYDCPGTRGTSVSRTRLDHTRRRLGVGETRSASTGQHDETFAYVRPLGAISVIGELVKACGVFGRRHYVGAGDGSYDVGGRRHRLLSCARSTTRSTLLRPRDPPHRKIWRTHIL